MKIRMKKTITMLLVCGALLSCLTGCVSAAEKVPHAVRAAHLAIEAERVAAEASANVKGAQDAVDALTKDGKDTKAAAAALNTAKAEAVKAWKLFEIAQGVAAEAGALVKARNAEDPDAAKAARTVRGRVINRVPTKGAYAVVVSLDTYKTDWKDVVRALVLKYDASVIIYDRAVGNWWEPLKEIFPLYVCFVARPTEIGAGFPAEIHSRTRKLDDDPYMDVIWAILTGADTDSAFRVAAHDKPLRVRKGMAGCYQGVDWGAFDEYIFWYEGGALNCKQKKPDGSEVRITTTFDNSHQIIDYLNSYKPDVFFTSGHGNHNKWNVGYGCNRGYFVSKGIVYGQSRHRKLKALNSPNPKIYIPFGNCKIGLVQHAGSMVPSWVKSGAAYHVAGYTANRSGWNKGVSQSVMGVFFGSRGKYTFAESFYLGVGAPGAEAARATFCLYGDPGWDARLKPKKPLATWTITEKDGTYTVRIDAPEAGNYSRTLFLPHRLKDIEVVSGKKHLGQTLDNYIVVNGKFEKGATDAVVFKAKRAEQAGASVGRKMSRSRQHVSG